MATEAMQIRIYHNLHKILGLSNHITTAYPLWYPTANHLPQSILTDFRPVCSYNLTWVIYLLIRKMIDITIFEQKKRN